MAGFDALGIVAAECGFTWSQTEDVVTGFALAAAGWRAATETELLGHAYYVAGAPAVLMVRAMGIAEDDAEMLDCASDLGVAWWLGETARAITAGEPDAGLLLPQDWLAPKRTAPGRLRRLAAPYLQSARYGAAHLPLRCRWAACTLIARSTLSGLVLALQHGPDEASVPLPRAAVARAVSFPAARSAMDAAAETAGPAR